jgi:hypothetical protein
MSQAIGARVSCPSCGANYRWKPELGGKKVRCKCGNPLEIPASPPGATVGEGAIATVREAAPSARCPSCGGDVKPTAVICLNCGYNLKTGQAVKTLTGNVPAPPDPRPGMLTALGKPSATAKALEERQDDAASNELFDLYLPAGMIALGVIVVFCRAYFAQTFGAFGGAAGGIITATVAVGATLLVSVPLLLAGLMAAAKIGGIGFGPIHLAVFKLMAISLGPSAIADMIAVFLTWTVDETGWAAGMFALFAKIGLYWALIAALFSLDLGETLLTVIVIYFVQWFAAVLIGSFLLVMLMG